jgi:uncharacterized SAM-binding protein YcdF (DUF218 family)
MIAQWHKRFLECCRARHCWLRLGLGVLLLALGALLVFWVIGCRRVAAQAERNEAQPADVIVVFGAAEYYGKPSPVLRLRLEKALDLYNAGLAPVIITTGGAGWDPKFTEGGVGHDFLLAQGVPDRSLIAETHSSDTWETAQRVAVIMRTNGMKHCLAVSDPAHLYRVRQMLLSQGLAVSTVPREEARRGRWLHVARESAAYMAWRLGFPFE